MATCPTCRTKYADDVTSCPEDGDVLLPDEAFASADEDLAPGTMVGEYRTERLIGAGSYGSVYAAEHPLIGKRAAIKVLRKKFSSEPQVVSRFISEARAVNRIRHRNIIDVFSFGKLDDGRQYLIMELLEGETLEDILEKQGRLSLRKAYPILVGVADALDAAHAEGIAHRDLKPENIFVARQKDGAVIPKLLDFGVAKLMGDEDVAHKTATGMAVGTPLYMSPEQCRGKKTDHAADVYAFGVVLFETLSGKVPFDGESAVDVLYKHVSETPPNLSAVAPDLPSALDAPIHAMLAKRPKHRPASVGEALAAVVAAAREAGMRLPTGMTTQPIGGVFLPSVPPESEAVTVRGSDDVPTERSADPLPRAAEGTKDTVAVESATSDIPTVRDDAGSTRQGYRSPASGAAGTLSALSSGSRPASGGGMRWGVLAAAVVAAGAIGFFVLRGATSHEPGPAADAPPPTAASSVTTTASESATASSTEPAEVKVRLQVTPQGAEVWRDDERLGPADEPLTLPRGDEPLTLVVKKPGYADREVAITPDEDKTEDVTLSLVRRVGRPVAPPTQPTQPTKPTKPGIDPRLGDRD